MQTLGLDIAKATFHLTLLRADGKLRHKQFPNTAVGFAALAAWLTQHASGPLHACLEATGAYGDALAWFLHPAGHTVSVVNPARIHAFAQSALARNKNDRVDATLIAHFCQQTQPAAWAPPPPALRELQILVRHLDHLIATRSGLQVRLSAGRTQAAVTRSLTHLIATVEAEIKQLEQQIKAHYEQHPDLKAQRELLETIDGIGAATAPRLLAELEQLGQFARAGQAAAYAGLTPRQHSSGSSVRGRTRLCKTGNSRVRHALYWPAITALRHNPVVQALGARLRARGKHKMVVIGAAMRKLVTLAHGVLKSGQPFDPNFARKQPVTP